MQTIYDKNGTPKTVEGVDAREHIATGEWFAEVPQAAEQTATDPLPRTRQPTPTRGDHR